MDIMEKVYAKAKENLQRVAFPEATEEKILMTVKELYEQMRCDAESTGEKYPAEKTIWNSLKKLGYTTDKETKRIVPLPVSSGAGNG